LIDCTAKAVTHRIAKFKKMASAFNGGKKGGEAAAGDGESDDGADRESTPKTPKSTKKGGKAGKAGKKRAVPEDDDDDDDDDDEQLAKKLKAEDSDNFQ
jgi:flagellar motor protein MotB